MESGLASRQHKRCIVQLVGSLLALLVSAAGATTDALPAINWYVFELAPQYIVVGPKAGQGFLDLTLHRQILPNLPGYRHQTAVVPPKRRDAMLKVEPNACVVGLFKTADRERFAVFSKPFLLQIPPGLLARRGDAARLSVYVNDKGAVSLGRLLTDGSFAVGMDAARSYGDGLDSVLTAFRGKPQLYGLLLEHASQNLIQMMMAANIDGVVAFPYEATFIGLDVGAQQRLHFYPVAEQPEHVAGRVACARGEFGTAVIAKVDALLAKPAVLDAIAGYYESWVDEESRVLARRLRKSLLAGMP